MVEERCFAETLFDELLQQVDHFGELREDEYFFVALDNVFELVEQQFSFAAKLS